MEMKKIIYSRKDGGVSIVHPASKAALERVMGELTDDQYTHIVWMKSVPQDAINPQFIDEKDIPSDREFRNAWKRNEFNRITVDFEKAKEAKIANFKAIQHEKLKETKEYLELAEIEGDEVTYQELLDYKKELLNYDQDIKKAISLEQLKIITPTIFNKKISKEQIMQKIKGNVSKKESELAAKERNLTNKDSEFKGAIDAIKGFMMLLPDMQKTLLDIKESLSNNNNNIKQ